MNRMENTPEQPTQTPTEASNEFLGGWDKSVMIGIYYVGVGSSAFLAGMDIAQGDSNQALLHGLVAASFGLAGYLQGLSQNLEVKFLKDKLLHRK